MGGRRTSTSTDFTLRTSREEREIKFHWSDGLLARPHRCIGPKGRLASSGEWSQNGLSRRRVQVALWTGCSQLAACRSCACRWPVSIFVGQPLSIWYGEYVLAGIIMFNFMVQLICPQTRERALGRSVSISSVGVGLDLICWSKDESWYAINVGAPVHPTGGVLLSIITLMTCPSLALQTDTL